MVERKKKLIHKAVDDAVDEAFRYYESRGYDGHKAQPQIIEDSKQSAEKLADEKMHEGRGFDYVASIASFLSCESRGCPITLRMAKNSSRIKIKIADLQKAREITGMEPKTTAVDWIDGVVRTLKNEHIISDKQESEIIEKTALEIPKIEKNLAPRYKTILAAHKALTESNIKVSQEEIGHIFNISPAIFHPHYLKKEIDYDKIKKDVTKLFRETPETLYTSEDLIEILKLENVTPRGLNQALLHNPNDLGILYFRDENKDYFGISEICGSGFCFGGWCEPEEGYPHICRAKKKNAELKFYSKN